MRPEFAAGMMLLIAVSVGAGWNVLRGSALGAANAPLVLGDADCDGDVMPPDALVVLSPGDVQCGDLGDVDCDGELGPGDAVDILRYTAELPVDLVPECPPIGAPVTTPTPDATDGPHETPAPTPTPTPAAEPTATDHPEPTLTATPTPTELPPTATQPPVSSGEPDCHVFPADNWWNTDISAYPVHQMSDEIVERIGRWDHLHPDVGTVWEGLPIGIPYVIVGGDQPQVPVTFYDDDESDPGPYPVPPNAPVEGQPVGEPNTAGFGGDRHVLVVDESNCTLHEMFDAWPQEGGASWEAGSGAVFDLNSNELRPDYWTSADAAGLPIFPGLVRYSEVVQDGVIDHALPFTVSQTRRAFIHPATHYASGYTDADLPPMGMRFRMKASYDCSWASAEVQVICTAMKTYGMFVADNGSDWYVSGAPDPRWDDERLGDLKDVPGDAFEVVETGEPVIE